MSYLFSQKFSMSVPSGKQNLLFTLILCFSIALCSSLNAQINFNSETGLTPDSSAGHLWGYAYGDFYYKAHGDSLARGGDNQYTGIPQKRNAFILSHISLGYSYKITKKFSADLLLAAVNNANTTSVNGIATGGDLLSNNKLSFYIKYANIRWKNIWKNTDLLLGQVSTPSFSLLTNKIWLYRTIEKTIADIRNTPSYDLGVTIRGKFNDEGNSGYDLMVGNGTGARPENDNFKWFYGDVYAMFLDKKLVFDLYADYTRIDWKQDFHHARNMVKAFVAYTTPGLTIGIETFINHGKNDVVGINRNLKDTTNASAIGISTYIHGNIIKNKLRFFARFDTYNPDTKYNMNVFTKYIGFTPAYEPNNKEIFITTGLDFAPDKNIHFLPNIWYVRYKGQQSTNSDIDHDLVYRATFYFEFGR
ncbi:MAG: hypothetical protein Q8891_12980 [Bacteroidota bacterium]|nr:hypothetical protein [Bacteroidota bacterium]